MEKAEFDLIVVGAGPAGSACAITAARAGVRVLLLEKDRFPRHKVCGEFVSPESLQLLSWLVGTGCFQDKPQLSHARIFSAGAVASVSISPAARSIPRFDLDAALLNAARQAGAEVHESTSIREIEPGTRFHVKSAKTSFTARAVVNATGRWSQLTEHGTESKGQKWIGLKGHFREAHPSQSVDLYFFDRGYCGVQPISANTINASAMVRADAAHSLEEVFSKQQELWRRSRDWEPLFTPITTSPLYFRRPQTQSRGMLLAGDSAAFIDPFAGDGISLALHTGNLAAGSLTPFFKNACSLEQAQVAYSEIYMQQFASAFRSAARVRMMLATPPRIRSILVRLAGLPPFGRALVSSTRTKGHYRLR